MAGLIRLVTLGYGTIESIPVYHYSPGSSVARIITTPPAKMPFSCDWCLIGELNYPPEIYSYECVSPEDLVEFIAGKWRTNLVFLDGVEPGALPESRELVAKLKTSGIDVGIRTQGFKELSVTGSFVVLDYIPEGYTVAGARLKVLKSLEKLVKNDVYLEVHVYLDRPLPESLAPVIDVIGREIPIHVFIRDARDWEIIRLERSLSGRLDYLYIHSQVLSKLETRCPACGSFIALRDEGILLRLELSDDGKCPVCGKPIPFGGSLSKETKGSLRRESRGETIWYHPRALPLEKSRC